jgi:hypothetical protein
MHRNGTGRFTSRQNPVKAFAGIPPMVHRDESRSGRQRQRYSPAWREAKLEAEEWKRRPLRVKVSAILVECLLWPLRVIGRFRD